MPNEGRPYGQAIHATAVAIAGRALLILGPSQAGKSRLACALIAASTRRRPIRLIGDDRILLSRRETGLVAHPHPRIAGFVERRGLGLVAMPFVAKAPVAGLVELGPMTTPIAVLQNLPRLAGVTPDDAGALRVLAWWRGASTTPGANSAFALLDTAQDWNW